MSISHGKGKEHMADNGDTTATQYYIDVDEDYGRAVKPMIVSRMGYVLQQSLTADAIEEMEAKDLIQQVAYQVADNQDFLLPDTPLKEAIFRVILANENKPMTAEEVSKVLEGKWSLIPYPREISPPVIERLLATSGNAYCIATIPSEEEEEDEVEDSTEEADDEDIEEGS
jgi:hypothetical protein